jgi:hypothetical protein
MPAEAYTVLRRSAEMFGKLGQQKSAVELEKLIADLGLVPPSEE